MAFSKSKKVKAAAPVVVDKRGVESPEAIISRQAAALARAWGERDAAKDQVQVLLARVARLEAALGKSLP